MIDTLQKCIEDMEAGVTNFCEAGKCTGCGQCCSDLLPLSDKEIRNIKKYIQKKHITPTVRAGFPTTAPTIDLICPFLDDSKEQEKCKIYTVRPKICQAFKCDTPPSKIRENKDLFWKTRRTCSMRKVFYEEGKAK